MGALALSALLTALLTALFMVKRNSQQMKDAKRKTYRLTFPSDLDSERVAAWLRSIAGTLRGGGRLLSGTPSISFELLASQRGIEHRLKVPWQQADYIVGQLRSLVAGIRVTPEDEYPHHDWTRAVEVGLTNSGRTLRITNEADAVASILASVQALFPQEVVMMQWVVTPTAPRRLPAYKQDKTDEMRLNLSGRRLASKDEIADRRDKLSDANMMAVLRVAAKANTDQRAEYLIYQVRSAMAALHSPSTRFYKRRVSKNVLQGRLDTAAASVVFPMQLSAKEMTAVIAWPLGNPFIAGLPQSLARHLPATELVPRQGRVIGVSNMPGFERPLAVSYLDARKHMHVIGPTGVGKTVLLANMLKQDMEHGHGVVLLETKGDLFNAALDYVPADRINDVIVMDIKDAARPVGFNILDQGDPKVVIDEITRLFEYIYDTNSVWTKEVLYHGLQTLAANPAMTFTDLAPLLVPMSQEDGEWRDAVIRGVEDKELRNFWQRFDNQPRAAQDRITQPVMDRIWQLNARPELRNIVGQSASSFTMQEVVSGSKILLINLEGLSGDTASLTGTLLMNALWNAVKRGGGKRTNFLYLDEFQSFLRLPVDPDDMLAKARSFGLGMVLAHQHLGQLPNDLRQAVMANARTKIVFQTSHADAQAFSREFGNAVSDSDFMNLGKYEAVARVATGEGVSQPFSLATREPARGYGRTAQIRAMSRERYGRPLGEIEEQIAARRKAEPLISKRPKPRISGT